jgi:hypothetical protein
VARAQNDPEDERDGGDDSDAGREVGGFSEAVRRDVHGATVGGGANRALTPG